MSRIEEAKKVKYANDIIRQALLCQRNSSPGQSGLKQWNGFVRKETSYDCIALSFHTTANRQERTCEPEALARALARTLNDHWVWIVDATIARLDRDTAAAFKLAADEARAILKAGGGE